MVRQMAEIELCDNPRDYEVYFAEALMRRGARKEESEEISAIAGAFDRAAVSVEEIPPFDPSPFRPRYREWYEILSKFSLLFYGFGSKVELLHDFGVSYLGNFGYVVEIDAFSGQPRLLQHAVNSLCELMDMESHARSMSDLIAALDMQRKKAFLLINSLDSDFVNDSETRRLLIEAAQSRQIFIVASIDRTPFFPLPFYTMMQFCTVSVETRRNYTNETGFSSNTKSGSVLDSIDRFISVLRTLTATANGIYKVLLKHQIKTGDGMTRAEWADKATTELYVRMQTAFPSQVNEFLDHKLISEKKDTTVCSIPLSHVQLQELMTRLDAEE